MPRPKKPADAPSLVNVSASLPAELVARVDEVATAEGRSRSNAIVQLVLRGLSAEQPRQAG